MKEEADKVWDKGTHLITIEHNGFKVSLYSVGKEFIEIHHNPTENRIEQINQASENDLQKYLRQIKLSF